ncbi:sensor histidine kinase [Microbacterium sp. No. 7]|uniref:sensor histidine kinase n=1 Tax=Microbacterium sp. No. 7 TaxID=1714373 RepID=UPI0006D18D37|nr:histidine kinase [Microbacterium sp. No. 7]ALJ18965.1 histidine kinase [Microbacterium sp. No. 7]
MFRPLTTTQLTFDVLLAVAGFLLSVAITVGMSGDLWQPDVVHDIVAIAVTAVVCAAFALRRKAPGLALGVAWVSAIAQMAAGLPPLPGNIAIFGVLYATAAYGTRLVFWLGFASAFVGAVVIAVYLLVPPLLGLGENPPGVVSNYLGAAVAIFVSAVLALLLSWTVGALVRTGIRARENRLAQQRAEADAAAEHERGRIARDMHDVVAHSLAVVIAQADGARYAAAADPAAATRALETISSTARAALSDVRLLLTQLRHSQADGPQPTLADLEGLYAHVRAAGVDLRVDVDPAPRGEAPGAVQLAVFRILQEALTNALRHGDGGPVDVRLSWIDAARAEDGRAEVRIEVRNGIRAGAEPNEGGHGLIGMSERASLVGGRLTTASWNGQFVVSGTIPYDQAVPRTPAEAAEREETR